MPKGIKMKGHFKNGFSADEINTLLIWATMGDPVRENLQENYISNCSDDSYMSSRYWEEKVMPTYMSSLEHVWASGEGSGSPALVEVSFWVYHPVLEMSGHPY